MISMDDSAVAVPVIDLLDSNMMKMYVDAAKDEYERAYNEQKEFAKEFGDLYSPSTSLNQAFYDQTRGRVQNGIDYLYKNGIDPLRSAEGRAYIQKLIRETPYQKIANWKSDAENMKLYNKAKAALMAEGKYDKDYDDYMLEQQGLSSLDQFNPYSDQRWTAISPVEYKSLGDLTKQYAEQIKPTLLDRDDVEALGGIYDPNNDYVGISNSQIDKAAANAVEALVATPQGKFEIDRIKKQMKDAGYYTSDNLAKIEFQKKVAASFGPKAGIQSFDANKFKFAKYQSDLQDQLDARKTARDLKVQKEILKLRKAYGITDDGTSAPKTIFDYARETPYSPVSANTDKLRDNGVALADPSGDWIEVSSTQKDKNDGTSSSIKQQVLTLTDGNYIAQEGGFNKFNHNRARAPKLGLGTGNAQISAKVLGGLTYNKKLDKYYIKAQVTAINDNEKHPKVGKRIWVEVKPGYVGVASNKTN